MRAPTGGPHTSRAWRDRAEDYRRFSAEARTEQERIAYRDVADNCDQIAERLEKLEAAEAARARKRP